MGISKVSVILKKLQDLKTSQVLQRLMKLKKHTNAHESAVSGAGKFTLDDWTATHLDAF